jgi:hypothetical protein
MIEIWLLAGIGAFLSIPPLLDYFSSRERVLRLVRRTRRRAIGDLQAGRAAIVGTVRSVGAPLEAPFSGRKCIAWAASVSARSDGEGRLLAGGKVLRDQGCADFLVEDDSGSALIRPVPAYRLFLSQPTRWVRGVSDDVPTNVQRFLSAHNLPDGAFSYRESILEEGAEVLVLGRVDFEPDAHRTAGYRDHSLRPVLRPFAREKLLICDDPAIARIR